MIEEFDEFATKFFTYKIEDSNLFQDLCQEVFEKKTRIKSISEATQVSHPELYATDWESRVTINSFEEVIKNLNSRFNEIHLNFSLTTYWTAFYRNTAEHPIHTHKEFILSPDNFSGILYLTSTGGTTFISHNPSSMYGEKFIPSDAGRIVMFPATLPHQVRSDLNGDEERCIIAFNGKLDVISK